jgi:hypothetical protein
MMLLFLLSEKLPRVLPALKEAQSKGLKLTSIINTHQYVARSDNETHLTFAAMVIMQAEIQS